MKPTIANLRKLAEGLGDVGELSGLRDNIAFYIAGAKGSAIASPSQVAELLDEARAADEFVLHRIKKLS